jgi:carboxyl-terminal processing protease
VVEDPDMPSEEDSLGIREADLDKHLANPNGDEAPPANKPDSMIKAPSGDKPAKDAKDRKPVALEPGEVVSKNDYQVKQALNLLKGLQILQGR